MSTPKEGLGDRMRFAPSVACARPTLGPPPPEQLRRFVSTPRGDPGDCGTFGGSSGLYLADSASLPSS
eukprot:6303963-Pyramimonas_sp.AAC.1